MKRNLSIVLSSFFVFAIALCFSAVFVFKKIDSSSGQIDWQTVLLYIGTIFIAAGLFLLGVSFLFVFIRGTIAQFTGIGFVIVALFLGMIGGALVFINICDVSITSLHTGAGPTYKHISFSSLSTKSQFYLIAPLLPPLVVTFFSIAMLPIIFDFKALHEIAEPYSRVNGSVGRRPRPLPSPQDDDSRNINPGDA